MTAVFYLVKSGEFSIFMMPKYIYIVIYLISFVVGLINYKKIKGTKMKFFLAIPLVISLNKAI